MSNSRSVLAHQKPLAWDHTSWLLYQDLRKIQWSGNIAISSVADGSTVWRRGWVSASAKTSFVSWRRPADESKTQTRRRWSWASSSLATQCLIGATFGRNQMNRLKLRLFWHDWAQNLIVCSAGSIWLLDPTVTIDWPQMNTDRHSFLMIAVLIVVQLRNRYVAIKRYRN